MISEKKDLKKNLFEFIKNKKYIILVLFISLISLIYLTTKFINLLSYQEKFYESKIDFNYTKILNEKFMEISEKINSIGFYIPLTYVGEYYDDLVVRVLSKNESVNFVFVIPDLSGLIPYNENLIEAEKQIVPEYTRYLTGKQAVENQKYDLAISYLSNLLKSEKPINYTKIDIYFLLSRVYYEKNNYEMAIRFINRGITYIITKKILTDKLLDFYSMLFHMHNDFNLKRMIALQVLYIQKIFDFDPGKISNDIKDYAMRYCKDEIKFFINPLTIVRIKELEYTKDYSFSLFDYFNAEEFYFIKKVKAYGLNYYTFVKMDILSMLKNDEKSDYYYFNIQLNNVYALNNKEGYSFFSKIFLPFGLMNRSVFLCMFIEKIRMVEFLSKKQYITGFILILIFNFLILVSIIIIFVAMLNEFKLNQMKTDFISIVSHELKTPITTIQLVTDTILRNYEQISEEKKEKYISKIMNESERLLYLINNLLAFSRNEKNKKYMVLRSVNLVEIVQEVVDLFKMSKKNVNFILDFSAKNMIIYGDKNALKQVVYNLLDNSYKYSLENKIIRILIEKRNNQIIAEFTDNGIGMSENDLKHVYERFYRGTETQNIPGTGLGLSLIKGIIDSHDGRIQIHSEKNKGTTITLSFKDYEEAIQYEKQNTHY